MLPAKSSRSSRKATTRRTASASTEPRGASTAGSQRGAETRKLATAVPRVDLILEALILALLAYLPLAFGGVMPLSQIVIIAMSGLIAACFAVRCFTEPDAPIVTSRAFWPLGGLVALVVFQLIPLPMGLLSLLSPNAAEAWQALGDARGLDVTSGTLSLYPGGTRTDLTVLLAASILIVVGATVYQRRSSFRRLLAGAALIGLAVATIGLTQMAFGIDRIYGRFEAPGAINSGPFASYSHYSEFLNLAIGCALGYLLMRAGERARGHGVTIQILVDPRGQGTKALDRVLLAFIVIGAIAIVMSTSRNGLMSLVVGGGVSAALMHGMRKVEGIGWPMVIAAGFALIGLLTLGVDPVIRRFQDTFADPTDAFSTRADLLADTGAMIAAFPLFGAGLGSFGIAFPSFDSTMRGGTAEHAENQYVEAFAELGIVGGLLGLTCLALVGVGAFRALRRVNHSSGLGLFGIAFGLAAIAFHSLSDFGLEIPAVGLFVAALLGATIGMTSSVRSTTSRSRMTATGAAALVATGLITGLPSAINTADAFEHGRRAESLRAELAKAPGAGTQQQHTNLVRAATLAAEADPSNVEYRFWAEFARWNQTIATAYSDALAESGTSAPITPETAPQLKAAAQKAVDALLASCSAGPTHGPTWSVAGQIQEIWLKTAADSDSNEPGVGGGWILRGRELAPHYPTTCLAAAFEYLRRDEMDSALAELDRAIAVGARKQTIIDLLAVDLDEPKLALPFAENELGLTTHLHNRIKNNADHALLTEQLDEHVHKLLIAACARSTARPHELLRLARIETKSENFEKAMALYQRMLSRDPYTRARFDYAGLLLKTGDIRNARRELRDVITYHPDHKRAAALLAELERPDTP